MKESEKVGERGRGGESKLIKKGEKKEGTFIMVPLSRCCLHGRWGREGEKRRKRGM